MLLRKGHLLQRVQPVGTMGIVRHGRINELWEDKLTFPLAHVFQKHMSETLVSSTGWSEFGVLPGCGQCALCTWGGSDLSNCILVLLELLFSLGLLCACWQDTVLQLVVILQCWLTCQASEFCGNLRLQQAPECGGVQETTLLHLPSEPKGFEALRFSPRGQRVALVVSSG